MDDILSDYCQYDPEYEEIRSMLSYYCKDQEFLNLVNKNDYDGLYQFAIQYGLIKVFVYLYEELDIPFDAKTFQKFYLTIDSDPAERKMSVLEIPIETGISNKTGLKIEIKDKFSGGREEIYRYFHHQKKYSKYSPNNGKLIYTYIKR